MRRTLALSAIALVVIGCTESKRAVIETVSISDAEARIIGGNETVTVWPYTSGHHFVCPPSMGDTVTIFNENIFGIDDWYIKGAAHD